MISECCGAYPLEDYEGGASYEDAGLCSECKEYCAYITEEKYEQIQEGMFSGTYESLSKLTIMGEE